MTYLVSSASLILALGMLVACADPNRINFVTTTNIAIDADATTQSISIGYDRYEGYVGPAYETGAVPPIVAKIQSNLSVLRPEVHQFYGTGNAAILATCKGGAAVEDESAGSCAPASAATVEDGVPCPILREARLSGDKRIMFFGTGSVIGLKVAWLGNAPESVTLGYKRKEFSTLPIGSRQPQPDGTGTAAPAAEREDSYGSVLASLDMGTNVVTPNETRLALGQFFATGVAAENLANKRAIRDAVEREATASVRQSLQAVDYSSIVDRRSEFRDEALRKLNEALFPSPQDPENPTINEAAFENAKQCMISRDAPSTEPSDFFQPENSNLRPYLLPVVTCMGL